MARDYGRIELDLPATADDHLRMRALVDVVWNAFSEEGVSWVGFYLPDPESSERLVLGPLRDKPACSPIEMHGACGQCFRSARPLVVPDVAALGAGYIACDPRDVAEVVVPCIRAGAVWAVLDVDSFDRGAFDPHDALGLNRLLTAAGLTEATFTAGQVCLAAVEK